MRPNAPDFRWNPQREQAARLVAEDIKTDDEIAASVGISKSQLERWKQFPDFMARVAEHLEAQRAAIKAEGIANKQNRIAAQNARWLGMQKVIADRAAEYGEQAPGGDTGLLVRTIKGIGSGDNFQEVHEYTVDTALLAEMRATEKHTAQEMGQWDEGLPPGPAQAPIVFTIRIDRGSDTKAEGEGGEG